LRSKIQEDTSPSCRTAHQRNRLHGSEACRCVWPAQLNLVTDLNDRTRFRDAWDGHEPERQDEGVFYNEQE
jgi:hypothetical protein